jgi:hypothetical protein
VGFGDGECCSVGGCQACVDGACTLTCTGNDVCCAGECCDADQCQVCIAGECVSTCDADACQVCDGAGTCVSRCAEGPCGERCDAGVCIGGCSGPCKACIDGDCHSICGPGTPCECYL